MIHHWFRKGCIRTPKVEIGMVHHWFRKGKRIALIMRNGELLVGKYDGSYSKGLIIDGQHIPYALIRSSTICKNNPLR